MYPCISYRKIHYHSLRLGHLDLKVLESCMASSVLPLAMRYEIESFSYTCKKIFARYGAQLVTIGIPITCRYRLPLNVIKELSMISGYWLVHASIYEFIFITGNIQTKIDIFLVLYQKVSNRHPGVQLERVEHGLL